MKIKLNNVRLAFPALFEAKTVNGEGDPRFSAVFLMDPKHPQLDEVRKALKQVAKEKWGEKWETIYGQLEKKLNRFDVREVMQRTEIARLRPLGADLSTYLQLRASAAGRKLDEFITPDGVDELRSRLTVKGPGQDAPVSLLYPLNVNNWMVAALNMAAELGAPRIDRDVVRAA